VDDRLGHGDRKADRDSRGPRWRIPYDTQRNGGTMTTAGASPVTYELDGQQ